LGSSVSNHRNVRRCNIWTDGTNVVVVILVSSKKQFKGWMTRRFSCFPSILVCEDELVERDGVFCCFRAYKGCFRWINMVLFRFDGCYCDNISLVTVLGVFVPLALCGLALRQQGRQTVHPIIL